MTTISSYACFAYMPFIAAMESTPEGRAPEPVFDPAGFEALVQTLGLGLFFVTFFVYLPLTLVGIVAWRARGKVPTPARLPSRDRALPPPPRGPDA